MTAAWQETLKAAWTELLRHPARTRQFRTKRLSPALSIDAYAAIRAADDAPCLLLEAKIPATSFFEVGGMRLSQYAGETGILVGLTLEDSSRSDLFTTVCADVIVAAASVAAEESLAQFLARLDAWRRFLRDRRAGMTRNETVGLLGELLVLERLLAASVRDLACWVAPDDGLHDFLLHGHALEIKTTLGSANSVRISTLDQLDTAGLRELDLIHVRLVESPDGRNLAEVIADIERLLPEDRSKREFANALLRRELMPDDMQALSEPRVGAPRFSAFTVAGGFPRLTRSTVPVAIPAAEYNLELRAIGTHAADFDGVVARFSGETP